MNLTVKYLCEKSKAPFITPVRRLPEPYDGLCGELADEIVHWLGTERVELLYIAPRKESGFFLNPLGGLWHYHMVPVIDGLVHDAWHPLEVMAPKPFVRNIFGLRTSRFTLYKGNGEDVEYPPGK